MPLPKVGAKAPAFRLHNQSGEVVNLKDMVGRQVVLYFYPKAMTPGCTTQACAIRDSHVAFNQVDAVVLGVSPDTVAKLQKFADRDSLNFDLLADEDHKIADKYGVWGPKKFMGREYEGLIRTTFIIDKQGKIQHIIDKVKTKSHHTEVLALLES